MDNTYEEKESKFEAAYEAFRASGYGYKEERDLKQVIEEIRAMINNRRSPLNDR